ncbi:MAG: hypothetical protein Q9172_001942 [Xanthocarpia lactea]
MVNDLRPLESWPQDDLYPQKNERSTKISLSATKEIINQCIRNHLQSFIVPGDDNGNNLLKKDNDDPRQPCAYQSSQKELDWNIIGTGDLGSAFIDFGDMRDTSSYRCERKHLCDDLPSLPAWPAGTLDAQLGTGTSADTSSSSARRSPAGSQGIPELRSAKGPKMEQKHDNASGNSVFRPMEDYIIRHFGSCVSLNESFCFLKPPVPLRSVSEGTMTASHQIHLPLELDKPGDDIFELDGKTLLLGDVAENGAWWLGKTHTESNRSQTVPNTHTRVKESRPNAKLPRIDWIQLHDWYQSVLNAGRDWPIFIQEYWNDSSAENLRTVANLAKIESDINKSSSHLRRTLLKATENLLRRPGRPLQNPRDCRFLLLLLANPLLYSAHSYDNNDPGGSSDSDLHGKYDKSLGSSHETHPSPAMGRSSTRSHTGIVKRILGLMANVPQESHRQLISWLTRYSEDDFRKLVDMVGGFVTNRLVRQRRRLQASHNQDSGAVLVPEVSGPGAGASAQLHAALSTRPSPASPEKLEKKVVYGDDWQVKAAAKVMSLLFQVNNSTSLRRQESTNGYVTEGEQSASGTHEAIGQAWLPRSNAMSKASINRARNHGQLLPTSAFYNSLLDYCDLVADFDAWENRRGNFSFCQYPMFLSLWAKIRILEQDARRQMEIRARQAFFNSIMSRSAVSQYLLLKVRRECLVDDSLRRVSEIVGSGQEEIKKSLRIAFQGEEGVDAGGLKKEWFLLLVREVFDPEHGMFVYDEDSQYCYFNPNTLETSDQYFLVGVVLGLAIYNSTILDVALPPFAFPVLASGLGKLLDYDGDVEATFCRDFVIESNRYGQAVQVPLCPGGEGRAVTNANRAEFVELYIKYLLDTSVSRQFEPFKRGFFSVCGGNALSLFRPEEIELLIRGSDETLDVATLRAVAIYDGWKKKEGAEEETVIAWFWQIFAEAAAREQRALLSFITGSDRLPAMGATSLIIKISCLGDNTRRFPVARTCFNMLGLYRYDSKESLRSKIWTASRGKHETGMSRLARSDADKEARDWFVHTGKSLGCSINIDQMGNVFAVRPGRRNGFPPTCAGLHLDTQPTGGRMMAFLVFAPALRWSRFCTSTRLRRTSLEEGARFPVSMVASGVWAGEIPLEKAHNLKEVGGNRRIMKQELERIGYLGKNDASHHALPLAAHFELHIGGVFPFVKAIPMGNLLKTSRWHTITVLGHDCHTGTTDFANRADALITAAKLILHSHRLAVRYDALASTGIIHAKPGSTNTVAGRVQSSLDIRASKDDVLLDLEK